MEKGHAPISSKDDSIQQSITSAADQKRGGRVLFGTGVGLNGSLPDMRLGVTHMQDSQKIGFVLRRGNRGLSPIIGMVISCAMVAKVLADPSGQEPPAQKTRYAYIHEVNNRPGYIAVVNDFEKMSSGDRVDRLEFNGNRKNPFSGELAGNTELQCHSVKVEVVTLCMDRPQKSCSYQAVKLRNKSGNLIRVHRFEYDYNDLNELDESYIHSIYCMRIQGEEYVYLDGFAEPCSGSVFCRTDFHVFMKDDGSIIDSSYVGHQNKYHWPGIGEIKEQVRLHSPFDGGDAPPFSYAYQEVDLVDLEAPYIIKLEEN